MSLLRLVRRYPTTVGILAALLVVWIIAIPTGPEGPFSPPAAGLGPSALAHHRWWALLTSTLVADGVVQFVLSLAATVLGVGLAERWMGWRRTLVAFLVTGIAASALGLGFELAGAAVGEFWSSSVRGILTLDPLTPIAGTLAWATAWAGPIERRRVRTLLLGIGAALLLYSGQPADLYLLVAVGIGTAAGALQHRDRSPAWPASRHETRSLLALVTVLLGVGPFLTLLSVGRYGVLSPLGIALTDLTPRTKGPGCVAGHVAPGCIGELTRLPLHSAGSILISLLPLVVLLIGALGLLRGRRAAVVLLAAVGIGQSLLSAWYFGLLPAIGAPYFIPLAPQRYWELALWLIVSTIVPLAYAVVIIVRRHAFPVRLGRRAAAGTLAGVAATIMVPQLLFVALGTAIRGQFAGAPDWLVFAVQAPQRLVPPVFLRHQTPVLRPLTPSAHVLMQLPGVLFWAGAVAIVAVVVLRGVRAAAEDPDHDRMRALLRLGSGSLGHVATWPDNRLWVAADGRAGIAYRLIGDVAVTVADPFGDVPDRDAVLAEFIAFCDAHARIPAFYSVHEEWRAPLVERGWRSLPVAEETVLDPAGFGLAGKAMQDVRTAVNRARRTDVVAVVASWAELPPPIRRQIVAISDHWVAERRLPEMGFTLGGVDELNDPDVELVVALDAAQRVIAVTSWLPVWRDGVLVGRTLDVMRRAPEAPNGAMEFAIAEAIERHRAAGIERTSLSATPLARPAEEAGAATLGSVLSLVGRLLEPVYGFRSLLRFKTKFGPTFSPVHLVYRDRVQLPAIAVAIARCYLPNLTLRSSLRLLRG